MPYSFQHKSTLKMDTEIIEWQNLRSRADAVIKQTLNSEQKPQDRSRIGKALAIYAKSDSTLKTLQMNQKRLSK